MLSETEALIKPVTGAGACVNQDKVNQHERCGFDFDVL